MSTSPSLHVKGFFAASPHRNYITLCILNSLTVSLTFMLHNTGSASAVRHKFMLSRRESLPCFTQTANSCSLFLNPVIGFYVTSQGKNGKPWTKSSGSCCSYTAPDTSRQGFKGIWSIQMELSFQKLLVTFHYWEYCINITQFLLLGYKTRVVSLLSGSGKLIQKGNYI